MDCAGTSSLADIISMPFPQAVLYTLARCLRLPSLVPSWRLGASHGDEIIYLFQFTPLAEMVPSPEDQAVSREMLALWSSFARSGSPSDGDWVSGGRGEEYDYYVIDSQSGIRSLADTLSQRFKHWRP